METNAISNYLWAFLAVLPTIILIITLWLSAKELKEKASYNNMSLEEYLSVSKQIRETE
jgi:hypothetical protein